MSRRRGGDAELKRLNLRNSRAPRHSAAVSACKSLRKIPDPDGQFCRNSGRESRESLLVMGKNRGSASDINFISTKASEILKIFKIFP